MRHPPLLLLLALLPAALAAQQTPARNTPRAVAGCYALTLGPWTPALPSSPAHALPARVALDTTPTEGTPARGSYRVRAVAGALGTARHAASWAPLPFKRDSLRIRWVAGDAGVDARLQVRASGELRGRASAFTAAAPGGRATATLVARRLPECAAPDTAPPPPPPAAPPPAPEPPRAPPTPPHDRVEEVAGYTVGGLMLWILLRFARVF